MLCGHIGVSNLSVLFSSFDGRFQSKFKREPKRIWLVYSSVGFETYPSHINDSAAC